MTRRTAIFDLGGVVLSWDPVRAFSAEVDTVAAQRLMSDVDFATWNRRNDAGRRFADGEAEVADTWPQYAEAITAYRRHFDRTLTGTVPGTSAVVAELAQAGVRLLGLTNWSDETFPVAQRRFGILRRLEAIVVSGRETVGQARPTPLPAAAGPLPGRRRLGRSSSTTTRPTARRPADLGLTAIQFVDADDLRGRGSSRLGMLAQRREVAESIVHIAERVLWEEARTTGSYPWSSHGSSYDAEGFVHLAYRRQVPGVIDRYFSRFEPEELVLLELDPDARPADRRGGIDRVVPAPVRTADRRDGRAGTRRSRTVQHLRLASAGCLALRASPTTGPADRRLRLPAQVGGRDPGRAGRRAASPAGWWCPTSARRCRRARSPPPDSRRWSRSAGPSCSSGRWPATSWSAVCRGRSRCASRSIWRRGSVAGEPGPVVVTGWVGVIIEKITAGYLDRVGSDIVAVNCVDDLEHFVTVAQQLELSSDNLLLSGLPILGSTAARTSAADPCAASCSPTSRPFPGRLPSGSTCIAG